MAQTPHDWHLQETYKSLITISVECLKILIVINGGAAVAMLTYIGTLVGRSSPPRVADITPALLCYCFGVFAAALAFMLAYLVQLKLYDEGVSIAEGRPVRKGHHGLLWTALLFALSSAVAFIGGCLLAASALQA